MKETDAVIIEQFFLFFCVVFLAAIIFLVLLSVVQSFSPFGRPEAIGKGASMKDLEALLND